MMPVIRITDETFVRLKRWAEPLEDSPEDAVRKVLAAAEEHLKCSQPQLSKLSSSTDEKTPKNGSKLPRLPRGVKTPQGEYRRPILEAIYKLGGSASSEEVLKRVEEKVKNLLKDVDYQKLNSGEIRWRNTAKWERHALMEDGLLKSNSRSGIWELSEAGWQDLRGKGIVK